MMKCPECAKSVVSPKACPFCGYIFTGEEAAKLEFYFDLKNNLKNLLDAGNYVVENLGRIEKKLNAFGEIVAAEIQGGYHPGKAAAKPEAQLREADAAKPAAPPRREKSRSEMELRLGQKWLLIVGITAIVFGIAYFLKYSFERGWVGPEGRVAVSYAAGIMMMAFGDFFRKKGYKTFGLYLFGGGVAASYFASFAAFQLYHLFSAPVSFAVMVLITVLAAAMSIVYDTKWLSVLALIGGFLTPVLLHEGKGNHIALFSYITVLNLGILGVAFYKRWNLLNVLGFILTYLVYTTWFAVDYDNAKFWAGLLFVNVFYLVHSVIPFVYTWMHPDDAKLKTLNITAPNAFIAFGYSYSMISGHGASEWAAIVTLIYAAVFLAMASFLYKRGRSGGGAFTLTIAQSALFLAITVPILFSRHWITIFWSAQAFFFFWLGVKLSRKSLLYGAFGVLALSVIKFLFYDYHYVFMLDMNRFSITYGYGYLLGERLITTVCLLSGVYGFASMAGRYAALPPLKTMSRYVARGLYFLFGGLLFIVLNIETGAFFSTYLSAARFAGISVLWAVFSVALMLAGFIGNLSVLRNIAFVLFAVTVIKVFAFDMSNISTPYRIFSFIVTGLILVGTSFAYHKYKDRIFLAAIAAQGDAAAPEVKTPSGDEAGGAGQ